MTERTIWEHFISLLKESVIIQGSVTLAFILIYAYMIITNKQASEDFMALFGLIIGFYFGSKSQMSTNEAIRRIGNTSKRV